MLKCIRLSRVVNSINTKAPKMYMMNEWLSSHDSCEEVMYAHKVWSWMYTYAWLYVYLLFDMIRVKWE